MRSTISILSLLAVAAMLPLFDAPAHAQAKGKGKAPKVSSKVIPRTADEKPDFQGVWQHPYVPDMSKSGRDQTSEGPLPFTAKGEDNFKNYDVSKFDYT